MFAALLATTPDTTDYYSGTSTGLTAGFILAVLVFELLAIVVGLVLVGVMWAGVFRKAGYAKWKAFVPFYSNWILVRIAGRPESHFWLQLIPYAGLYWSICTLNDVAKSFGKDSAYTVGLVFLPIVFASMLSYGEAQYRGPSYLSPEQKWQAQQYAQWYAQQNQPGSGPTQ
jgi:hypothetical protein